MCPSGATSLKILKGQSEAYGSRKNSQYNYKKKMVKKNTNNDLQNTRKQKIEQQQQKRCEFRFSEKESSSCVTSGTDCSFDKIGL